MKGATPMASSRKNPRTQGNAPPVSASVPDSRWNADVFNAVLASFLGWTLDAFDFFVLIFVLPRAAVAFRVSLGDITLAISATLRLPIPLSDRRLDLPSFK